MALRFLTTTLILTFLLSFAAPLAAQDELGFIISWHPNPEPDIAGYVIYRSLDQNNNFTLIDSVDAGTHTYTDTQIQKDTRYYYRLVAKTAEGDRSALSEPVSGFMISRNAGETTQNLCKITGTTMVDQGSYEIEWRTSGPTTGFIQFDTDIPMDSSTVRETAPDLVHSADLENLAVPGTYFMRAAAYDDNHNMTISAIDTLVTTGENPAPVTTPVISIYPVPYNPNMGQLFLSNLPANSSVAIYNGNGLEVWSTNVGAEENIRWEGVNNNGSMVMSGVYYVIVKNSDGKSVDERTIIIAN